MVITATETAAQRYATVFPEYFVKALGDVQSDLDKNGRTSIWELFASSSGAVARHYTERAQLTTERAMLSDTGDKAGVQATVTAGPVGTMARSLYLDRDVASESADPAAAPSALFASNTAPPADSSVTVPPAELFTLPVRTFWPPMNRAT